jgi:hypothetical protein
MRTLQQLAYVAGVASMLSAVPTGAAGDCIAALHPGQHSPRIVASANAEQERLDEYLELHARALEATGGLRLGVRLRDGAGETRAIPAPRGTRTSRRGDIQG